MTHSIASYCQQFSTESLAVLLAMNNCGMTTLQDIPADFPDDRVQQKRWLDRLTEIVVDRVWQPYQQKDVNIVIESAKGGDTKDYFPFCSCHKGVSLEWVF